MAQILLYINNVSKKMEEVMRNFFKLSLLIIAIIFLNHCTSKTYAEINHDTRTEQLVVGKWQQTNAKYNFTFIFNNDGKYTKYYRNKYSDHGKWWVEDSQLYMHSTMPNRRSSSVISSYPSIGSSSSLNPAQRYTIKIIDNDELQISIKRSNPRASFHLSFVK